MPNTDIMGTQNMVEIFLLMKGPFCQIPCSPVLGWRTLVIQLLMHGC